MSVVEGTSCTRRLCGPECGGACRRSVPETRQSSSGWRHPTRELAFPGDNSWAAMHRPVVKGRPRPCHPPRHRRVPSDFADRFVAEGAAVRESRTSSSTVRRGGPARRPAGPTTTGPIHPRRTPTATTTAPSPSVELRWGQHRALGGLRRLRAGAAAWDRTANCRRDAVIAGQLLVADRSAAVKDAGGGCGDQRIQAGRWLFAGCQVWTDGGVGDVEQPEPGHLQRRRGRPCRSGAGSSPYTP